MFVVMKENIHSPFDSNDQNKFISTLENTEGVIKKGQSRETGNLGYRKLPKNTTTPLYANKHK